MGNMIHTDSELFGMGLVAAHGFDQSGGVPRIALDQELIAEVASYGADLGFEEQVRNDPVDQTAMLHTLLEFEDYDPTRVAGKVVLDGIAARIARQISHCASNPELGPSVTAKWKWFRDYWNRSVDPRNILPLAN